MGRLLDLSTGRVTPIEKRGPEMTPRAISNLRVGGNGALLDQAARLDSSRIWVQPHWPQMPSDVQQPGIMSVLGSKISLPDTTENLSKLYHAAKPFPHLILDG